VSHPEGPLRRPPGLFAGFLSATAFFTRLPVDPHAVGMWRLAESAWAFPFVGAGIGGIAGLALLMAQLIGLGTWPAALISVVASIALTGALHEDGFADTADGFLGGRDREERLAILRDSRHGTYGVLALILSMLLRVAALTEIADPLRAGLALIAAHAASRAALPITMWGLMPARPDGLGATAGTPRPRDAIAAALIGGVIALAALGLERGIVALCLAGASVFAMAALARRRIGGYTGDVLGAFQQMGEIVILIAASVR